MMLPVDLVMVRVPESGNSFHETVDFTECWLDPHRVDTITQITQARRDSQAIPAKANAIIRYTDPVSGFRLIYVQNSGKDLARRLWRMSQGDDPSTVDFGSIPDGL